MAIKDNEWKPSKKQALFLSLPFSIKEAAYAGGAGSGKALSLDTIIPTPDGYKTIQDIHPGDYVYNYEGKPTIVWYESDIFVDHKCYRVTFDSGISVIADADHLWLVHKNQINRNKLHKYQILSTKQLFESTDKWSIIVAGSLEKENWQYPIDPYTLGVWLGDGSCGYPRFTGVDEEIVNRVGRACELSRHNTGDKAPEYGILGVLDEFREFDLILNKHIPELYYNLEYDSRLALLQGLMDTDGTVNKEGSGIELSLSDEKLAFDSLRLIRSLGIKAHCTINKSVLNGENYKDRYRIKFATEVPVFSLTRKAERHNLVRTKSNNNTTRNKWHYISSIDEVDTVPTKCLQVDGGLYLITEACIPTHNTDLLLIYPLVHKFHEHPRFKQLFLRRTYPEIRDEIVPRSKRLYEPFGAKLNQSTMTWTFPSGARVIMGHCENEDDVHRYDSTEINLFTPDEITSFTEYQYLYIAFTRVRSSDPTLPSIIRTCGMPGNIGHCVRFGEVLTPSGWKDIKEIQIGDLIYEVNDSLQLEESLVHQVHIHEYNGQLWQARTSNLFIECTPEHRVPRLLGKKGRDFNYTLTAVKDLPGQANLRRTASFDGSNESTFVLPMDAGNNQPRVLPYNLYAKFMGWFLSEGSILSSGRDNLVSIAQTKPGNLLEIKSLLNDCGFHYSINENGINFYSLGWWTYLYQFGKCRNKFIPRDLLNASIETQRYLFTALMDGDGHWVRDELSGQYYTTSKQLCDDFCELAFKLGYLTYFKSRQRENRVGPCYEVYFQSNETTEILTGNHLNNVKTETKRKSNVTHEDYSGLVYDIGVPKYHTFVIRQNGYVWISGNSWFKKRFVNPCPEGGKVIIGKGGIKRFYIHSTLLDNPGIDPNYKQSLMALPEAEKRAKLSGDWDAFLGSVFDEFRSIRYPDEPKNALHVIPPFDIPDWWPKIVVGDWGFAAMTWVGFAAISPDKRLYIYREMAWRKTKISEWAAQVKYFIDKENPKLIRFCKSAGQDRGQEHTIQQQIEEELGHPIELSHNTPGSRVAGKLLIHEYLRWRALDIPLTERIPYNEEHASWLLRNKGMPEYKAYLESYIDRQPENNLPRLQIFDTNSILIDAIKAATYDRIRVEDIAEFDGDDPLDGLRYIVDAAEGYFAESSSEFSRLQEREALLQRMAVEQNWTAFYRNIERLEGSSVIKPVGRYHHAH